MISSLPRWLAALPVAFALAFAGSAGADESAETFVSENANTALGILNDDSLELTDKKQQFRALVDQIADVPKITRFVLGRYARGADPQQMSDFSDVFRQYAIGVYEERLGDYAGETLTVTGSTDRRPGDSVVHTEISGGGQDEPLPVNWRVLTDADTGQHKVVDVEVYGVWLALNQREEIVGIIEDHRGRIAAATGALRTKIAELDYSG